MGSTTSEKLNGFRSCYIVCISFSEISKGHIEGVEQTSSPSESASASKAAPSLLEMTSVVRIHFHVFEMPEKTVCGLLISPLMDNSPLGEEPRTPNSGLAVLLIIAVVIFALTFFHRESSSNVWNDADNM